MSSILKQIHAGPIVGPAPVSAVPPNVSGCDQTVKSIPDKICAVPLRMLQVPRPASSTTPAAPVSSSSEKAIADAATPAATASPSSETVSTPVAAATTPTVTHRRGSLSLLISFVVLVIVLGTLAPLVGRWRKRKILERTGTPNLSFTNDASSDRDKPEPLKVA